MSASESEPQDDVADFSLIQDDASYRFQRWLGLIPASGMGIERHAIILRFCLGKND